MKRLDSKRLTARRKRPFWLTKLSFVVGLVIVAAFVLISFAPGLFTSIDPLEVNAKAKLLPPGSENHLFGTDHYGRDILSRVLHGARIDLLMGVLGVLIPLVIGVFIGLLSAYYGGWVDALLMRTIDILMAFPFTILVIVVMTILGQGMHNVFIALWIVGWMSYARLVRGEVLVLKNVDFIQAARVAGFPDRRILFRHILPNAISSSIVFAASDVVLCMLTGASMSFLGLGIQPPAPEWGAIMNEGRGFITYAWWITLFPGLFMAVTGIGFSLLGDAMVDFVRTKDR